MKLLKNTLYALLLGGMMTSCNFLEKEPMELTPETYFNTADEASSFLTGIYAILGQASFYGENYIYLEGGDDLETYGGASARTPATKGLVCVNALSSDAAVTGFWYTLYSGINRANMFLENIDKVQDMDATVKAQYIAEARFLRAFYYFNLVQNWGDVPFRTESTDKVTGLDIPCTDRQTIYDFIISEMSEVSDEQNGGLLTAAELNFKPGHVSKSAAWGMLARVYLFRAGEWHRQNRQPTEDERTTYFAKASEYGQKVMGLNVHELAPNYWDFFIDICGNEYNTTANESLWEAEFAGNYTTDIVAEGRWGNIVGLGAPDLSNESSVVGSDDPGYSYEFFFATPYLYKLYEKNGDKERFYWNLAQFKYLDEDGGTKKAVKKRQFFSEEAKNTILNDFNNWGRGTYSYAGDFVKAPTKVDLSRPCAKYRREYEADKKNKNFTSINYPILRYADVLLMVAEAENEVNGGPTKLAKDCLTAVRERAGLTYPSGIETQDKFREAIKEERAMEFCFEFTRRNDLIRWGELTSAMLRSRTYPVDATTEEWKQATLNNAQGYLTVDDTYNYFPIPDAEMSVNKAITTNNPGW